MKSPNNQINSGIARASMLCASLICGFILSIGSSFAYGEADVMTTLRTPLIPGVPNAPSYSQPWEGQGPPVGDGSWAPGVTPGMLGGPCPPPSALYTPITGAGDKSEVNSYVMPYLNPPPSTMGYDYSNVNGSSGGYGLQAPVSVVNINPNGGIQGDAPTQRWCAQRSYDHGRNVSSNTSYAFDFGQKPADKPDAKMTPQISQDGPRGLTGEQGPNAITRCPNMPNSQATALPYGNRILRSDGQKSKLTIAPY